MEEQNNETDWINPDFEGRAPTVSNILASWIPQAEVVESIAGVPAESKPKRAKRKTKTPRTTPAASSKKGKASKPKTDEQRRLHKNAAVRAWREKNRDRYSQYLRDWRAARAKAAKKSKKITTKMTKTVSAMSDSELAAHMSKHPGPSSLNTPSAVAKFRNRIEKMHKNDHAPDVVDRLRTQHTHE